MRNNKWWWYVCLALLMISCNVKPDAQQHTEQLDEIAYGIERNYYAPKDLGVVWFTMRLINPRNKNISTLTDNMSSDAYHQILDYYLNHAQKDLSLEVCGQVLMPVAYHFENNFNLVGYDIINVGFDIETIDGSCTKDAVLVFNNRSYNHAIFRQLVNID